MTEDEQRRQDELQAMARTAGGLLRELIASRGHAGDVGFMVVLMGNRRPDDSYAFGSNVHGDVPKILREIANRVEAN